MGISCVVAESYARIFYRNCINVGLLPVTCAIEAEEGDTLTVDFDRGTIVNETKGMEWRADYALLGDAKLTLQSLIAELKEVEQSPFCPHGRPVFLEITTGELEKRFGRT
jgi:3-isopropylmalate dehydratase small subunit